MAAVVAISVLPTAVTGTEHSDPVVTVKKTYETPPIGIFTMDADDPAGVTADGSINLARATFDVFNRDDVPRNLTVQASIVDDVFGAGTVGGEFCIDFDQDADDGGANCEAPEDNEKGDQDEMVNAFCGTSAAEDHTFHPGKTEVVIHINGPFFQVQDCDSTAAPTATTGGILNPAGGMFASFSRPDDVQPCEDRGDDVDVCIGPRTQT